MPSAITKARPNRRNRRRNNVVNRPQPTVGITISSITSPAPGSAVLNITFAQPVSLNGIPQYSTDVAGAVPIAATMTGPTTLQLTFDQDVSLATVLNVPYEEPAVRNPSGGFVTPASFTI